jgi:hypothetical protein
MTKEGSTTRYVHRVREETQTYILELLEENNKLRLNVAGLEGKTEHYREEKLRLQEQLLDQREKQERVLADQARLQVRLADAEATNQHFSSRYVELEEHNGNLANLYVASYRLHETVVREEVLTVLQEIVINLVGSEAFAILERTSADSKLEVSASFGVEAELLADLDAESGPIARTARTGKLYVAATGNGSRSPASNGEIVACIPLRLGEETVGVIAIFRLLPQKAGLEPLDHELFELLASHAATSLYVSRLHGEAVEAESTT